MCGLLLPMYDMPTCPTLMMICTAGLFRYGFEFMGLNGRLVITALTDRYALQLVSSPCIQQLDTAVQYKPLVFPELLWTCLGWHPGDPIHMLK